MAASFNYDQLSTPTTNGIYHDIRIRNVPLFEGSRDELCHYNLPHFFYSLVQKMEQDFGNISFIILPSTTDGHKETGGKTACGYMRFENPAVHARAADSLTGVSFRGNILSIVVNSEPPRIVSTAKLTYDPEGMPKNPSRDFNANFREANTRNVNLFIDGLNGKALKSKATNRSKLESQSKRQLTQLKLRILNLQTRS